jgi:hypothetical protein
MAKRKLDNPCSGFQPALVFFCIACSCAPPLTPPKGRGTRSESIFESQRQTKVCRT